jgi:hypothetical protein
LPQINVPSVLDGMSPAEQALVRVALRTEKSLPPAAGLNARARVVHATSRLMKVNARQHPTCSDVHANPVSWWSLL